MEKKTKTNQNQNPKQDIPLEERVKQLEDQLKAVDSVNLDLHENAQKSRFHAEDILSHRTSSIERMLFSAIFFCSFLFSMTNVMMIGNIEKILEHAGLSDVTGAIPMDVFLWINIIFAIISIVGFQKFNKYDSFFGIFVQEQKR